MFPRYTGLYDNLSSYCYTSRRLVRSPLVTNLAIVLTAVEEGISRASMIERDRYFRRRSGKGDYSSVELAKQHVVWTAQIGQSMLIEISAILVHSLCVVLFLPHRFAFNLGYGETEGAGVALAVVLLNTLLELTGELLTDHMALRAEMEHGVPADSFFSYMTKKVDISKFFGSLLLATGVVLWTFSRVPTLAFCDSVDPCSCLNEEQTSNFEVYRAVCTCAASKDVLPSNTTFSNTTSYFEIEGECSNLTSMSSRFETNPVTSVDSDLLVPLAVALCAFVATAALIYLSVSIAKNRKRGRRVQAEHMAQSAEVQTAKRQVAELQDQLHAAQRLVTNVMAEGGKLLDIYHLDYSDIDFGGGKEAERCTLGEGAQVIRAAPPPLPSAHLPLQTVNNCFALTA